MKTLLLILAACLSLPVLADDHGFLGWSSSSGKYGGENRGKPVLPARLNATWLKECGSCHMAYAPGLLPAESWRRMMGGLDKHFGDDASLTQQENREISAFLIANASNRWTAKTAPRRITDSQWFIRKHDEIAASVWKRASIKSPGNCVACHADAADGGFEEHGVRIPR